jgi:hypothetical protein
MLYRVVRARYPNVGQVEFVLGAMQVHNHCMPATSAENFNFFLRNCSSSRMTGWNQHTTLLPTTRSSHPLPPATIQRMDFFRHSGLGCVTHHTSHMTHHTSHITHHSSHLANRSSHSFIDLTQVGGVCAEKFTPQASYWCSNDSQGGGPGPYYGNFRTPFNRKIASIVICAVMSRTAWHGGRQQRAAQLALQEP